MMDRRAFLKAGGLAVVTLGAGPTFLHRAALAADPDAAGRRKVLITLFQRGAMDGLMAVPPLGDPALRAARPRLAMSGARGAGDERVVDLGVGFGLHPAFSPLLPLWRDGRLGVVHAVGSPDPTRSHFDAQDYMETGTPGRKGTADGWLNRVVGQLGHDATPFRAVSMTRALPRSLYGNQPALAVTDLRDFRLPDPAIASPSTVEPTGGFEQLYGQTSERLLRTTARETFEAVETLERLDATRYRPDPAARYPNSALGHALRQIAFLVKSDVGLEVAFAESGGWDTHVQQGTVRGAFARQATDLANGIAALWTDLGHYRDDVVIMTMTEFGRTVRENGSGGTDHGHASCLFVVGNDVKGGIVHGRFPGLGDHALYEGRDLAVTTDFRSVFAAVAGGCFGPLDDRVLFPGWTGSQLPVMKLG